jgi:signal transduction histidine kinase
MREVKLLKHLPWLVLFLLFSAGTALWLLFVNEQQFHVKGAFQSQLEHLSDELLRSRLQGQLGPDSLPEGIRAFAVYDAQGTQAGAWGIGAPDRIDPAGTDWGSAAWILVDGTPGGTLGMLKRLDPLRSRMMILGDGDDQWMGMPGPGGRGNGNPPGLIGRRPPQGFTFVLVGDEPLQGRLWAWTVAGGLGTAAWAGFTVFVGVLWFRARRYQTALVQHRELLQFAEASRTLSHELQNPLAAILLQTALLKRSSADEPPPEVTIIEEEARRMSTLVSRVRDFLKDPSGQPELVDLADLANTLAGRFAVSVAVELVGGKPFWVRFDPHRLRSVVENLMKNAVESGPEPCPRVVVSRPKQGWVRLEVLDSGAGFTPASLKQALNPFFTTKTTGTGIGLSIADSFVQAAGGRLKLENRPEGGARVALDLPEATGGEKP